MFIEQAYKGNNTWWRVAVTAFITSGIFIFNFILFFISTDEQMEEAYAMLEDIPKNLALVINLIPFVFLLGLLFLMVYLLNERNILTLTTSRKRIDYKRILFSFLLVIGLSLLTFLISYQVDHSAIEWHFKPVKFAVLFLISIVLFPFQIGFEEYLFRGYLMQQIGIIAKNRWVPLIVTSLFFGAFHSVNPEVAKLGYGVMIFYIGTGLLLGIMTLMDESIELALGFHLGNNLLAALLITSDYSALQTDAIFKYTGLENTADILNEMIISIVIVYPIILFIFGKKYNWTGWLKKLTGKIDEK